MEALEADGIIGLAPAASTFEPDAELFIEVAYEQGVIDEKIFSLLVGDGHKENFFTIGGYDLESYATSDLTWHDLIEYDRWSVNFDAMLVGDDRIEATSRLAFIDSGASFIMMPRSDFTQFYNLVKRDFFCNKYYWGMEIVFCDCT